jgi:peptide/nickel transport system permease protein
MPVFWLSPILSYYLAYEPTQGRLFGMQILPVGTRLFPIDGYVKPSTDLLAWAHHLVLPWFALAAGFAAIYARFVRALTMEELGEDYARAVRAKGCSSRRTLLRHCGRNVAPVVITLLGIDVGVALGGALFVETVFALPGLGYVGLSSIENLDYPLTVGVITFAAICAVLANTIVDLVHAALDPRIRLAA